MPEQAEFVSDSGDYTWKPEYARRAMSRLNPAYDTSTLAQKLEDALKRIAHLEAIVHKYINQDETL